MARWRQGSSPRRPLLARRAAKGPRKKRTRPEPRQYTIADLERARDRVAAAERRIDNDRRKPIPTGDALGLRAGAARTVPSSSCNYACAASLSDGSIELSRHRGEHVEGARSWLARPNLPQILLQKSAIRTQACAKRGLTNGAPAFNNDYVLENVDNLA